MQKMKAILARARDILQTILTIAIIIGITTILYLYTSGYRLQKNNNSTIDLTKTGMVNAKSIPEAASVYLDDKLVTATNDNVAGVEPGKHQLRIVKKGFVEWKKEIEVFPELVTDITALLVSQSPRLEPLTNTGAKYPIISPTLNKLAYFSTNDSKPGIYVIPLGGINQISLFRSNPNIAIKDTKLTKYSEGTQIEWSPDENSLLVSGSNKSWFLIDLQKNTAETTAAPELVKKTWQKTIMDKRLAVLEKLELTPEIKAIALKETTLWSPDEKKFFYMESDATNNYYKVYNLEKPLPIGEKVENTTYVIKKTDNQPRFSWYPDSFHLIMVEGTAETTKQGIVSLIRIDGTNKTEIYSNTLLSSLVFSSPGGDKVIVSTSFKSSGQTDLYTISIR